MPSWASVLLARMALAGPLICAALAAAGAAGPMPTPDHVVVAVMENHSYRQVMQGRGAPFIASLAGHGALFTNSFAVAHPSQPNYFALFSGSTHGVADNEDHAIAAPSLAGQLRAAGKTFIGFAERGSPRKHNPWESFADASAVERDFTAFPRDFDRLPTVSFVIPNLADDMHNGSIAAGDAWLRRNLAAYAAWCAATHNVLILTFDEDDDRSANRIPTIFFGEPVKSGRYTERIDHYRVLRTIEAMFGLPPIGRAAEAAPIDNVWAAGSAPEDNR